MRKRIVSGMLVLLLCATMLQPVTGIAADVEDLPERLVQAWTWTEGEDWPPRYREEDGQWALSVPCDITRNELLDRLPPAIRAELAPQEEAPETADGPAEGGESLSGVQVHYQPEPEPVPAPEEEPADGEPAPAPEGKPADSQPAPAPEGKPADGQPAPAPEGEPADGELAPAPEEEPADRQPQTAVLELTWTVDDLGALADGGDLTATAALPAGYALADGAAPLSIMVLPCGAAAPTKALPECEWYKYEEFREVVQDLPGTKINLFDYWTEADTTGLRPADTEGDSYYDRTTTFAAFDGDAKINLFDYRTEADTNGNVTAETRYNTDFLPYISAKDPVRYNWAFERFRQGINEGTPYKFSQQGYRNASHPDSNDNYYNIWTNGDKPFFGIVKNVLEGRYPVLAELPGDFNVQYVEGEGDGQGSGNHGGEYWYDRDNDHICSLDYLFDPDIQHSGKAAYENANGLLQVDKEGYYYYDSTKNFAAFDGDDFRLYNKPAVFGNNTDATKLGQFFPFNTPDQVFKLENGQLLDKKPADVLAETNLNDAMNRQPFINHYFGMTMTTRFAQKNGGRTYRGQETTYEFSGDDDVWVFIDDVLVADLGGIHDAADLSINFTTGKVRVTGADETTIRKQFIAAGREGKAEDWSGDTFADDTYHTLRFFFLERGNNESNVKLKFNMVVIPESGIIKTDQFGNPVAGADFSLYPANVENGHYYPTSKTPIYRGTTGKDGQLNLMEEETGGALTFEELSELGGSIYFVLREESVPAGYRQNSDTYLHYDPDTDVTVSENQWQTGSHSQTMVTATLKNIIQEVGENGTHETDELTLKPYESDLAGKVYAVVFRYMGDETITSQEILEKTEERDWRPVVPTQDNKGWTVIDQGTSDEAIRQAIEAQPYTTYSAPDGSQKLNVTGLPGDPNSYYHLWSKKLTSSKEAGQLLYTVNFYYVENGRYHRLDPGDFGRDFSVRLFIPNIKNYLVVHKVDGSNNSLIDAEFGLYRAADVEVTAAGYNIKPGAVPYDTVTTRNLKQSNGDPLTANGCAMFPSPDQAILEMGEYYLIETQAPSGYLPYEKAIHVIVDNSGVYVDAGTEKDGLTTSRYVGSLVHSMRQFAVDDKVDATLHDIKVQMQNTDHYEYIEGGAYTNDEACQWSGWDPTASIENRRELHLNYQGTANEFGSTYHSMTPGFRILGVQDSGWSQLYIRQCMGENHSTLNSPKQDLADQNLRNLFSTVMVAHVVNTPEGGQPDPDPSTVDVSVKKEWKLDNGGTGTDSVTVELLKDGAAAETVILNEANGWSCTWSGLPADHTWTVREVNVPLGFTPTITQQDTSFVITNDDVPDKPSPTPTRQRWMCPSRRNGNWTTVEREPIR